MNLKVTLSFLLLTTVLFGQGVAKKNQDVYDQWILAKKQNDSLLRINRKESKDYDYSFTLLSADLNGVLKALNYSIEETNYKIFVLIDKLNFEKISLDDIGAKPKNTSDYYGLLSSFKKLKPISEVNTNGRELSAEFASKKAEDQRSELTGLIEREKQLSQEIANNLEQIKTQNKIVINQYVDVAKRKDTYSELLSSLSAYHQQLLKKEAEIPESSATNKEVRKAPVVIAQPKESGVTQVELIDPRPQKTNATGSKEAEAGSVILDLVEVEASFPGGAAEMSKFLRENMTYPSYALDNDIEGRTYLRFVVTATGEIENVTVTRGVKYCEECDNEAARVIRAMPNWIPAQNNGKPVYQWYNLPIKFTLDF